LRAYALIPARSGSKGLPDKTILPIEGHPPLACSAAFARLIPVGRCILSTDSERCGATRRDGGADAPRRHPRSARTPLTKQPTTSASAASSMPAAVAMRLVMRSMPRSVLGRPGRAGSSTGWTDQLPACGSTKR